MSAETLRARARAAEAKVARVEALLPDDESWFIPWHDIRAALDGSSDAETISPLHGAAQRGLMEGLRARVEAAIRLLGNDDITPAGARILRAALNEEETT